MLTAIQQGDKVIYIRHAKTNSQKDQKPLDLSDCAKQRNLSEEGKEQSRMIGEAFQTLNIPVGQVLSSPYCRAKDTAQIAFGQYEIDNDLRHLSGVPEDQKAAVIEALDKLLQRTPAPGTNIILVSHSPNLSETTGIVPRESGSLHIFQPRPGGYEYLGKINPDEWPALLKM